MKEFDEFMELTEKSLKKDPWVKDNNIKGYCDGVIEEAKETIEAIKENDPEHIKEELGDIFYAWAHACKLAEDQKIFTAREVIQSAIDKIKRRKPYILEDRTLTREETVRIWMEAKEKERQQKETKTEEYVYFVDVEDKEIGRVSRRDSMLRNLWHRGTYIIVENPNGDILVHQRTITKSRFAHYYDVFFGGYVSYGETYDQGAERELYEEAGIKAKLEFLFKFKYDTEETKSHGKVYRAVSDGPFIFQKEEVEKGFFMPVKDLKKMIKKEKFCPDGLEAFKIYLEKYRKKE